MFPADRDKRVVKLCAIPLRAILKRAAAWFAQERSSFPGRGGTLFVFGLAVVTGCSDLFGPAEQELRVTTDRTDYVATYLGGNGSGRQYGFEVVVQTEKLGGPPSTLPVAAPARRSSESFR